MRKIGNKKGVSIMVAYVLLIVIVLSLAILVYVWMKKYVPKQGEECDDNVALSIDDYCFRTEAGKKFIDVTIKNTGLFNVNGFFIRISNSSTLAAISLEDMPDIANGKAYTFLRPENEFENEFDYTLHNTITNLEVEPFVVREKSTILCENAVVNIPVDESVICGEEGGVGCENGAIRLCTKQQGVCLGSSETCAGNVWPGCVYTGITGYEAAEITCDDSLDNDCDGSIDNADSDCAVCTNEATQPCYSGPAGTEGVGICVAGTQTCAGGAWGSCVGEVIPTTEICGNAADENCNGIVCAEESLGRQRIVTSTQGFGLNYYKAVPFRFDTADMYPVRFCFYDINKNLGIPTPSWGEVVIEIRTASGTYNYPSAPLNPPVIARISGDSILGTRAQVCASFDNPILLTQGTNYAIVVSSPTSSDNRAYQWSYDDTASTGNWYWGRSAQSSDSGATWALQGNTRFDFTFNITGRNEI